MLKFEFERVTRPAAPRRLSRASDGDTPVIDQPVRMVSVDTPEKAAYAGLPPTAQVVLDRCRDRLKGGVYDGMIPDGLRDFLLSRLTRDAAERHIAAGNGASAHFDEMLNDRLTRPNGRQRSVGVIPAGELIDRYGRLLAYVAPWYAGGGDPLPPRDDPRRRTFNLDMVASGWGAMFMIYPSLPNNHDLNLLIDDADLAWRRKLGAWEQFGETLLLGYEYRACVKLGAKKLSDPKKAVAGAYQRICVDLRDLSTVGLFDYYKVPPSQRLWIWQDDYDRARIDLDLPAD